MVKHRRVRRGFQWKRFTGYFLLALLAGVVTFVAAANFVFYGARPADLPCRDCFGAARSVRVNGFNLYYREAGADQSGTPIVILHGGPGHSSLSFKQGFDFLAGQRRVVYYDQRGSGNSQVIPDSSAYTVDQLVEELEALRRDVIQADQIIVLGHSAGGALAQRYALKYPAHVARLVLVSSIQINNGIGAPILWDRFLPALFMLSGRLPADPVARDQWFTQLNEAGAVSRLYDPARADLLQDMGSISFTTWRDVSRSLEGDDFQAQLAQLNIPTLILYGAADSDYTGEANASRLCGLLPDCSLARFEHSGHWPFLEEPDRFAQVLNDFLLDQ